MSRSTYLQLVFRRAAGLLVFAAMLVLFVLSVRTPPTWRLDAGAPGALLFLTGFFPPEQTEQATFRWSTPDARLTLHGARAAPVGLMLRTHSDEAHVARTGSDQLHLSTHHAAPPIATFQVASGWHVYHLLVPPDHLTGQGAVGMLRAQPLHLASSSYCPDASDDRVLGVPVDWIQVVPLKHAAAGATVISLQALLRALLLTGVLVIFFAGVRRAGHLPALLLTTGPAVGLCYWLWRDPYTLAWAMQPLTSWLVVPLLLVAVVWAVSPALVQTSVARIWSVLRQFVTTRSLRALLLVILVVGHLLLLWSASVEVQAVVALLLLGLPGALLALRLLRDDAALLVVALFLGLCGALVWMVVLLLVLQALPGALPWWLLLLVCDGMSIVLLWTHHPVSPAASPWPSRRSFTALVLVVLLGAALRLPFLGGAEFQGDEARAMLMAAGLMHGQDEILLLHRKGPVEVILPAAVMVLTRQVNEWAARLPFALAGVGVVIGCSLLGERIAQVDTARGERDDLSAPHSLRPAHMAGLIAATILATDGFLIAFSRIVQYQSILVCLTIGAVWCGWRFYEGAAHPQRYLLGAALLISGALLAHYDAIMTVPVLLWLVVAGGWRRGWRDARPWLTGLVLPVLTGAVLVGSFYLPFVLHDHFAGTLTYMLERGGQGAGGLTLYNNLPGYYERATFYNTTFQMNALALILLAGIVGWLIRYGRPRPLMAVGSVVVLLVGVLLLIFYPSIFALTDPANLAMIFFSLPLIILVVSPATPAGVRTLLLWFGVPFLAESFLIGDPRTHFYTMHAPAALLIGLILAQLLQWLEQRRWTWLRVPLALGGISILMLAVPYLYLVFLQQNPEYQRTFPAARPDIYRAHYGDSVPEGGHFGFPHYDGWGVVGELYRQGVLDGTYTSNQRERVTGWYTRGAFRCDVAPDYYMLTTRGGNASGMHIPMTQIRSEYDRLACVMVDGTNRMNIYRRAPVEGPPQVLRPDAYQDSFDAQPVGSFPIQRSLIETVPQYRLGRVWQRGVVLHGYDLDRPVLESGTTATLVLSWQRVTSDQAVEDAPLDGYDVVVRLLDGAGMVVAHAVPVCHPAPPAAWSADYTTDTAFTIAADTHLDAGEYTIQAGLRHRQTQAWLPLRDGDEQVTLTTLQIHDR